MISVKKITKKIIIRVTMSNSAYYHLSLLGNFLKFTPNWKITLKNISFSKKSKIIYK